MNEEFWECKLGVSTVFPENHWVCKIHPSSLINKQALVLISETQEDAVAGYCVSDKGKDIVPYCAGEG